MMNASIMGKAPNTWQTPTKRKAVGSAESLGRPRKAVEGRGRLWKAVEDAEGRGRPRKAAEGRGRPRKTQKTQKMQKATVDGGG
eukprot:gene17714-biopygen405